LRRFRQKLSYANVMSTIAVVLALGGATAVAASGLAKNSVGPKQLRKNAVTGAKVKNRSLTGADVNASSLGKVPSAARADTARSSDRADSAGRADVAATASNLAKPEAAHFVGRPGEPLFATGWKNASDNIQRAEFYLDREGVVHLQGKVERTAGNLATIFFLPAQYRPKDEHDFAIASDFAGVQLAVSADGAVIALNLQNQLNRAVFLDGVTWQAGG